MSYYKIARILRVERERLGVLEHDLHAMRYRGVMELAWAGCDDDEIMSFSGHKTIKYAGFARQVMRATTAAEKRQLWERLLDETRTKSETDTKGDTL